MPYPIELQTLSRLFADRMDRAGAVKLDPFVFGVYVRWGRGEGVQMTPHTPCPVVEQRELPRTRLCGGVKALG